MVTERQAFSKSNGKTLSRAWNHHGRVNILHASLHQIESLQRKGRIADRTGCDWIGCWRASVQGVSCVCVLCTIHLNGNRRAAIGLVCKTKGAETVSSQVSLDVASGRQETTMQTAAESKSKKRRLHESATLEFSVVSIFPPFPPPLSSSQARGEAFNLLTFEFYVDDICAPLRPLSSSPSAGADGNDLILAGL